MANSLKRIANTPRLRFSEFEGAWSEKQLGNIAQFSKGKGISKADISVRGALECIRYGQLYTEYGERIDKVVSRTNVNAIDLVLSERNDIIIPASGETEIDIATASCVVRDGIALGGDLNIIKTNENGVFLSYYFNGKKKLEIARLAQGISVVHLYGTQLKLLQIHLPTVFEQEKIATFLGAVDKKITQLTRMKYLLQQYKKGCMQKLFSQMIRFKDANENDFPNWEKKRLNEVLFETKHRNGDLKYDKSHVLSVSGEAGIVNQIEHMGRSYAGASVHNYHVVEPGDIVYTKSPLKANPYGIIKANKGCAGIVSTLYAVYRPFDPRSASYLDHYFSDDDNLNRYLRPLVRKGAKNDMKINNAYVLNDPIVIPIPEEQEKISFFLDAIDTKISLVSKQLEHNKAFKKGLLQQMFV